MELPYSYQDIHSLGLDHHNLCKKLGEQEHNFAKVFGEELGFHKKDVKSFLNSSSDIINRMSKISRTAFDKVDNLTEGNEELSADLEKAEKKIRKLKKLQKRDG